MEIKQEEPHFTGACSLSLTVNEGEEIKLWFGQLRFVDNNQITVKPAAQTTLALY